MRNADFQWFTTSLIPAFSPRRRRIVRHSLENSRDWICRTAIQQTRNHSPRCPLLGERKQVRAGVKHKSHSPQSSTQNEYRKRVPVRLRSATARQVRLHPLSCDFSATSCPCGIRLADYGIGRDAPPGRPFVSSDIAARCPYLNLFTTSLIPAKIIPSSKWSSPVSQFAD